MRWPYISFLYNSMLRLKELAIVESREALRKIPEGKVLINTINAHSFNVAQKDELFAEAISMRISCSAFNQLSEQEIAGEDGWLWGNAKE